MIGRSVAAWSYWSGAIIYGAVLNCFCVMTDEALSRFLRTTAIAQYSDEVAQFCVITDHFRGRLE